MIASRGFPLQSLRQEPLPAKCRHLVGRLSWSWAVPRHLWTTAGIALLVQRPLYVVTTDLEVFPTAIRASAVESASNAPAPANLRSPSESDRNRTATGQAGSHSRGVWSLSAHAATEARLLRVYLTRHLPTSGFLTLLPVYVFRSLPALFRAGNARRVFLQGLFPSRSLRPLPEPVTFVTLAPPTRWPTSFPDDLWRENLAFKALLSARIRHRRPWG